MSREHVGLAYFDFVKYEQNCVYVKFCFVIQYFQF